MPERDEQLITRFRQSGCVEDLNELLSRHLARIRRIVYSMVLDQDAADDVTQEIFLRVVRSIDSFDGRALFSTWLYRISMNAVHTFLDRRNKAPVDFGQDTTNVPGCPFGMGDRALLEKELSTEIHHALDKLSPRLRAAIVLIGIQEIPPTTAAQIENCSTDTMYWRVHEARRQLKEHLKEYLS